MPNSAPTVDRAIGQLTRRNQLLLDGRITAVLANGQLVVDVGRGMLECGALVDHAFRAGETVRLMRDDAGEYLALGPTSGGRAQAAAMPAIRPSATGSRASAGLAEAFWRVVDKQSRPLKRGRVAAIRADGTLEVTLRVNHATVAVLARSATTQTFVAGQPCHAIKTDRGGYLVVGSTQR